MGVYKKVTDEGGKSKVVKQPSLRKRIPMAEVLKIEAERDTFRKEIDRLSTFITERLPGEIREGETAVDVAIRVLDQKAGQRLDTLDHK